jgi:hypothetical protein
MPERERERERERGENTSTMSIFFPPEGPFNNRLNMSHIGLGF